MEKCCKGTCLVTEGLQGQYARETDGMQAGCRIFFPEEKAGELPGQDDIQDGQGFPGTDHGGRQGQEPYRVRTGSARMMRTADKILCAKIPHDSSKSIAAEFAVIS